MQRFSTLLTALLIAILTPPAWAVIEALTPLEKFVADADSILVARVEKIDLAVERAILQVESALKGKTLAERLPIRLTADAAKALTQLKESDQLILFITRQGEQELAYGYAAGSWFLILGQHDGDAIRWQFKAGEPYLRRTYSDETAKLIALLTENLEKRSPLPPPDQKIEPGFGIIPDRHDSPSIATPTTVTPIAEMPDANATANSDSSSRINGWFIFTALACGLAIAFILLRSTPMDDAHA